MTIGTPFKGFIKAPAPHGSISQYFGDNPDLYHGICLPTSGGKRCLIGHNGIDMVAPYRTPILCVEDGYVLEVKEDAGGFGKHVRIISQRPDHAYEWVYGHFSEISCKQEDKVVKGQVIGYMGNTGFVVSSSNANGFWKPGSNKYGGTHLHLGKRKYGVKFREFDNGYFGYVDFLEELPNDGVDVVANEDEQFYVKIKLIKWVFDLLKSVGIIK